MLKSSLSTSASRSSRPAVNTRWGNGATTPSRIGVGLPDWTREPLLHFVVLGALLFGVDHLLFARNGDPRTIVVGADVTREARELFKASSGRDPTPAEMKALRDRWLDNEVLYREGLAMQVDKGDIALRERVIFKALSVIDANVEMPPIDDGVVEKWFEAHRGRYDRPVRFDFEEAVLSGDTSESAVRAFAARLNSGTPGDIEAGLRVFRDRPMGNVAQSYGPDFANALLVAQSAVWQAMRSKEGWRAIKLDARVAPEPSSYSALRNDVLQDWKDAALAEQRSAAVRALTKKYTVRDEDAGS